MMILVFGDSIAAGAFDQELGGWVNRLNVYCMKNTDNTLVYNLSVSGETTVDLLKRFRNEVNVRDPDLVIAAIGTNDSRRNSQGNVYVSLDEFKNNLQVLLEATKKIIFVGLLNVNESIVSPVPWDIESYYSNKDLKKYNSELESFSINKNIPFIQLFKILSNEDLEDGLHPNSKGHEKIFKRIKDFLEEKTLLIE